jgi:hypothetical protein
MEMFPGAVVTGVHRIKKMTFFQKVTWKHSLCLQPSRKTRI